MKDQSMELLTSYNANVGGLHVCRFSPDSSIVLVLGGEREEMVKTVKLEKFEAVKSAFS